MTLTTQRLKAALKPKEHELIELLEEQHGRSLTDQEISLALEQAKAIGEL